MGNMYDTAPTLFSKDEDKDNPTMHTGDYLQTYVNPTGGERFKIGKQSLHIGAKMIQDVKPPNDIYVVNKHGQKVWLSKNGKMKPTAGKLLKQDPNFGLGPSVRLTGSPLNPKLEVFSSHDMSKTEQYMSVFINSEEDLRQALEKGHLGMDPSTGKFGMSYGQLAIDPFYKRPSDIWSGVASFNRGMNKFGTMFVVPAFETAVETLIPGFQTLSQLTGLHDVMQHGVEAFNALADKQLYKGSEKYDLGLSNQVHDPRLKPYLERMKNQGQYFHGEDKSNSGLRNTLNMPESSQSDMLKKARELTGKNSKLFLAEQVNLFTETGEKLREIVGNNTTFNFMEMYSALRSANTPAKKMKVINHYTERFKTDLMPMIQKKMDEQQTLEPSEQTDKSPTSQAQPSQSPQVSAPPQQTSSWVHFNDSIINGDHPHPSPNNEIHG